VNFQLEHMIIILYSFIFFCTLIFQYFLLILKNFYSFFKLSKVLRRILYEINIFVPS